VTRGPDNPFAATGAGTRYARGRPYHHPGALARARGTLGFDHVDRALDVACGTGMSTVALTEVARVVVGTDRSPEMLAAAPRVSGATFVRSAAESLPFAEATFDAVTVCSGIHWFDQPRFFAEARRVLHDDGWIALYDHYFIGEMVDVPAFGEWTRVALEHYPLPPRAQQVGDPRSDVPAGFDKVADEFYADDIEMTHGQFVDYQLSISNFVAAGERGVPEADLRAWLAETTVPFFDGVATRTVRFLGSLTCLRPASA
jgi:ubiquinone/menaquinone biosynthesis C-methylase UbiE